MFYDVAIVGAGPSGSYLALSLARRGYAVLVMEKKTVPGKDICCTGIVSQRCLELLEVPRDLLMRPVSSVRVVSPSGDSLVLRRDDAIAWVVDRPALDRLLAERAGSAGASCVFCTRASEIMIEDTGVTVKAECYGETKSYNCRVLAIASGFGSSLPAKLGLGRISDFTIGAQAEVRVNTDEMEVYVDEEVAPGSFAWLVPTREGMGLAGLMVRRQPKQQLNRLLRRLAAEGKIAAVQCQPKYAAIPLYPLQRTFGSRVVVVGEAAGQVKPLTGGGIYYGALCAGIAAEVLGRAFRCGDFSEKTLSCYQRRWQDKLGKEFRTSYLLHRIYRRLDNGQVEFLYNFAVRYGIADFLRQAEPLYFDYHSRAVSGALKHLARSLLVHPVGRAKSSDG